MEEKIKIRKKQKRKALTFAFVLVIGTLLTGCTSTKSASVKNKTQSTENVEVKEDKKSEKDIKKSDEKPVTAEDETKSESENEVDGMSEETDTTKKENTIGSVIDVKFEKELMDREEVAVITGVDEKGNAVWTHTVKVDVTTELSFLDSIGMHGEHYYYAKDGAVVALKLSDGSLLWKNEEFGGGSISSAIGADGTIYLCGYYGPDFYAIDSNGNTLKRIEEFNRDFCWAGDIKVYDNYVEVTMDSEEDVLFRVNLDDYSYERVE